VSPQARRLRWPARALLRPGYRALAAVGAVSAEDAARLIRLGADAERIVVTGDPRNDGALDRARAIRADDPLLAPLRSGTVLVAGSTWPEDEEVLLEAFQVVLRASGTARLVLVPHEPTPEHLARLEASARRRGIEPIRLDDPAAGQGRLLIVDRTGVLAPLYGAAALAWVGGGYGRRLHSVLEPAACGVPVLFGPDWQGSPDAAGLLGSRAAAAMDEGYPDWLDLDANSTFADRSPLAAIWLALLRHPAHRQAAGARAREAVAAGAGAAARSAALVERLIAG
jgi:3-deoxy-D-manno-octulosonic-acid transferase